MRRLRMGVVGCADVAWRRMLPAMRDVPDVEIVTIASRDLARATAFTDRFGGTPLASYEAVLRRDDVDAVYIPLPALLHAEWIERSLRAGKHVLVEKPMTDSFEHSSRLTDLARSRGLVLLENFMFLYHSQHAVVGKLLDDGVIGELRSLSGWFTIPPKPEGDIRYEANVSGGAFLDFGGYPVRAALHFLGPDLDVVGAVFRQDRDRGVVMSGTVLMCTSQGVTAPLEVGMEHSYRNSYALAGSTGRIVVEWAFTPPPTHRPVVRIERQDHHEELVLAADDQFGNVVRAFVQAVGDPAHFRLHEEGTLQQAAVMDRIARDAVRIKV